MLKKWAGLALIVVLLVLLAVSAGLWLPPLLGFVGANTDLIQGLTDLIQLGLWMAAAVVLVVGWLRGRRVPKQIASSPTPAALINAEGEAAVATTGGVAARQVAVGRDVQGDVILVADPDLLWEVLAHKRPPPDLSAATKQYLAYLVDRYRYLDFRGMGVSDRVPLRLALIDLYVPLKGRIELPEGETWARDLRVAGRRLSQEEIAATGQRLSKPLPAVQLLQEQDGLIVLGDPGAGKTTFLKYLALHMALGLHDALGMAQRIPFLLPLSAYANRLVEGDIALDRFLVDYYRAVGVDLSIGPILERALARGGALLLLDGLDEVKDLAQRRTVVERVVDFFTVQRRHGNKFVLTSRIVGYREVRPTVEGFAEATLVDFEQEEIEDFIDKWTVAIEQSARGRTPVATQQAEQERAELRAAVERNEGVRRLASNPLLLTILALMKRQGVTLPQRRIELYRNYVETLLKHWNLARGLGRPPARDLDVVETLKVLAPLALWMHETSPGAGLVKQEEMRRRLEAIYAGRDVPNPEQAAAQFLADVHDHAGLLVERGPREYGFIHLTFQEYLAAVAIAQQGQLDVGRVVDALAEHVDDDNWHEVSLLTIGYLGIVQQQDRVASAVIAGLVEREPGSPGAAVVLAGECVLDAWPGGVTPECRRDVRHKLIEAMRTWPAVAPIVRAQAGRVLGKLGDSRVEVLDPLKIEWCEVPAGPFRMGSKDDPEAYDNEKPQHELVIPYTYRISRYPITNAQYGTFVDAGGYHHAPYWREAEAAGRGQAGAIKGRYDGQPRRGPVDYVEPFSLSNHPVVGITWYEALAFTRWLTDQMREAGSLANGWVVALPSEAEWEKASRGTDGRIYPWDGPLTPVHANYDETGIGTTSAVGCFPQGASPYAVEEMSGNVWEWTRSLWGKDASKPDYVYPYDPDDGREQLNAGDDPLRVLRGGSFNNLDRDPLVRCAQRGRSDVYDRYRSFGFRIVLSPLTPLDSGGVGVAPTPDLPPQAVEFFGGYHDIRRNDDFHAHLRFPDLAVAGHEPFSERTPP